MRPTRTLVLLAGAAVALGSLGACSSSDDASPPTTRAQMTFQTTPPEASRLGVCASFTTAQMQELLGGDEVGPALPEAIEESGGAVTGESCQWELRGGGDSSRSVRIEARDYGSDTAALATRFDELKAATPDATDLPGIQDAAFSASSDEASLVQVRLRQYLLTASSRGTGDLEPLTAAELGVLLGTTFEKLP
ncbi:MAG: hypothetical protein KF703_15800 [Actinobacteria bacterium]|nr:hypothetical protein [Actinomycetota bacterium]